MEKQIYLDNAAAMKPEADVRQFYMDAAMGYFANVEAVHSLSYRSREALKCAGERVSGLLFARRDYPVIWGTSATELFRLVASCPKFAASAASLLEHPALTANFRKYTDFTPLAVDFCGRIIPGETEKTFDLAAQYQVQSELGIIGSCGTLSAGFRLIDAVQAAGKLPIERNADGWIISGVKFGAPGGAALLLSPDGRYTDILLDHAQNSRHQDYAVSRVDVPLMLTMVHALEAAEERRKEHFEKVSGLNSFIRQEVSELGIVSTLPEEIDASPYILNMLLPSQESAVVVRALSEFGIFIASGSACSAESGKPSAALTALGFRREKAYRAIRISFGFNNTQKEAEIFISGLKKVLKNY